jgi:hypothetical protein
VHAAPSIRERAFRCPFGNLGLEGGSREVRFETFFADFELASAATSTSMSFDMVVAMIGAELVEMHVAESRVAVVQGIRPESEYS